jgi:endo-1,4-beta-D-glucanase Y
MENDPGDLGVPSVDVMSAANLVRRAIHDIDANNAADGDVLLADLLCAAWPTPRAQSQ